MKRRVYSEDFKIEAVAACLEPGANKSSIARNLELSLNTLHNWINKYGQKDSRNIDLGSSANSVDADNRLKFLEKENKRLALELEILKKALGILTKELP